MMLNFFFMSVDHLDVFFREAYIYVLCPYLNCFLLLLLLLMGSINTLYFGRLIPYWIYALKIFSHYVDCFFVRDFEVRNLLSLIQLSLFAYGDYQFYYQFCPIDMTRV